MSPPKDTVKDQQRRARATRASRPAKPPQLPAKAGVTSPFVQRLLVDERARLRSEGTGLSYAEVAEIQRGRIVAATVEAVAELGYRQLSVAAIISRAKISRKTFYEIFIDREDCFVAAFERASAHALAAMSEAWEQHSGWSDRIRAALGRLLELIDEEPALARLWFVEAPRAGEGVTSSRTQAMEELAKVIDQGRLAFDACREPPELTAEGLAGGVCAVLHMRLLARSEEPLTELLGPLMYTIALPYLGSSAARRELGRTRQPASRRMRRPVQSTNPLEGLNTRVTYRTLRVLAVIQERPHASNREIAAEAGVADQGQISKLLSRLERLELIQNHGLGPVKGASNAWQLTPRGSEVVSAWGDWVAAGRGD